MVYDTAANILSRFETRKFARYGEESRQAEADTRRYLTCDLLILDDLGSEFTSPFVQAALYELINTRLIEGKRTVISSNLNLEGVRQRYSPRWPPGWRGVFADGILWAGYSAAEEAAVRGCPCALFYRRWNGRERCPPGRGPISLKK